jgi:hypothetical protein
VRHAEVARCTEGVRREELAQRSEVVRLADRRARQPLGVPAIEAAEHASRPELQKAVHARPRHALHRGAPTYRRGELVDEELASLVGVRHRLRGRVGDDRDARIPEVDGLELGAECLGCGLHEG